MHGNVMLVNGIITPTLTPKQPLIRLRLLNGSNARIYNLAFHDLRTFVVIAGDGGFLPAPEKVQSIRLAPGERAEIVLDMSNGDSAILKNIVSTDRSRGQMMGMGRMMGMMNAGNEEFNIMKIDASSSGKPYRQIPDRLVPLPDWQTETPARSRYFQLEMAMGPRMMIPFPAYSDSKRPYMYHCQILEHEDAGMMGQFTVES